MALLPVGRGGMGATQALDAAEWIAVAPVPAIISQAQFDRAQERLAHNRQMARRNNRAHPYLLRGLVSCGQCRLACCGRCTRAGYAYYVCPTRLRSRLLVPGERCPARYIPACALDDLVWRDLCEVIAAPEMIAHAMARARGGHWLPQELQARRANLRRGRAALGQQIERLTDADLAGVVPMAEYQRRRRDTEARLQALDRQETELTHDAERQGETVGLAAHAEAFCRRVRDGLAGADFDQKRALLDYRDGHGKIQAPDRPQASRPQPACAAERGRHGRRGAEPDDPNRKARLRPGCMIGRHSGTDQPMADPCTNTVGKAKHPCVTQRCQIPDGIATQVEATCRTPRGSGHGGVQEEGGSCG